VLSAWLQSTRGRLVVLLGTVAAIVLGSAALAHFALDQFDDYGAALWSATLHLLDPSSLHDDEGAAARSIGVFQVITGLVLLVGLLFTFVSETVGRSIERLGQRDRPVRARDHLLVVGGGVNLISVAARAAAEAIELRPAFERFVVLAPEAARERRGQLRAEIEAAVDGKLAVEIVFGDAAGESGFELAAADRAAAILLMPLSSGPVVAEMADIETVQTGLALRDFLDDRGATPLVRLLFRRGRNVDAAWELLPDGWDALVGDRTIAALVRLAITRPGALAELPEVVDARVRRGPDGELVRAAWKRAEAAGRPLRLAIVGCGFNAPALLEDLAAVDAERFDVTVLSGKLVFERYLGEGTHSGIEVRFIETRQDEPERLADDLRGVDADIVLVTPSPIDWDLRRSDAEAVVTLLHVRHIVDPHTPLVAELFLPDHAARLPADRNLFAVSSLNAIAAATALSLVDPEAAAELERRFTPGRGE
jgi:hypothetical protein